MIYWPTALRLRIRLTPGHLITLQQHTLNPKVPLKHSAGPDLARGKRERERSRKRKAVKQQLSCSLCFLIPFSSKPEPITEMNMSTALSHLTNRRRRTTSCHYKENTHIHAEKGMAAGLQLNMLISLIYFNLILEGEENKQSPHLQLGTFARCMQIIIIIKKKGGLEIF